MQEARPPDGGWGWIIALCSFVNHALIFGILFSMSIVYVSWLEEFGNSKSTTSWIISTCSALSFLSGPLAGTLAAKYGFRFTATLGGLLAALGFMVSYLATSVLFLIMAIGVITGVSCGLIYLSSLAVVVVYFDKKRALATGIGMSGVGVGSFCMPQLVNKLVEIYGWRGCHLIVGGLILNMCVTGALMRPLDIKDSNCGMGKKVEKDDAGDEGDDNRDSEIFEDTTNCGEKGLQIKIGVESKERLGEPGLASADEIDYRQNPKSMFIRQNSGVFRVGNDYVTTSYDVQEEEDQEALITTRNSQFKRSKINDRDNLDSCDTSADDIVVSHPSLSQSDENIPMVTNPDVCKLDTFNSRALFSRSAPTAKNGNALTVKSRSAPTLNSMSAPTLKSNPFYDYFNSTNNTRRSTSTEVVVNEYAEMQSQAYNRKRHFRLSAWQCSAISVIRLNIRFMKDNAFLLFSISQILVTFSFLTPVVYMVDRAIDNGISKSQGAWLVSYNGVGSLVGRLLWGIIADRYEGRSLVFYTALVSSTGVLTMMSPLCGGSIFLHGAYAAMLGHGMGGLSTLFVVITVDLVGPTKAVTALGILMWFAGFGHLLGPPFAGFIYDVTQSYTVCYVVQGFMMTCSGLMLIPIFRIRSGFGCCGASRDVA